MSLDLDEIFLDGEKDSSESWRLVRAKKESYWITEGERRALTRFHRAAKTVPAYRKFLRQNGVNPKRVRTIEDFALLPETTKKNYIQKFSPEERSPYGTFAAQRIFAASSGTTGTPTLWPRGPEQEAETAATHDFLFRDLYEIEKYRTLLVIGFPMGVYVSGMATALPSFLSSLKHQNLAILTAGNNKESILGLVPKLQDEYQQIIFAGHPFFVKDIIETGTRQGIRWSKNKIRTFFVSEGFSEEWRSYIASRLLKSVPERDLLSMYGSSEFLLMGYESPESILIRRAAEKNSGLRKRLFGERPVPSVFHFNPTIRYIETNENEELLFTAWSGIPLIRYNLRDTGQVFRKNEITDACASEKVRLEKELKRVGWRPWNLPFVTLHSRSDYTLVFYAANIYPENIHHALDYKPFLSRLTGKFTMEKILTRQREQEFIIHIELAENAAPEKTFSSEIGRRIFETLKAENLEFRDAEERLGKDLRPRIILHPFRDPVYFPPGLKPRYIRVQ